MIKYPADLFDTVPLDIVEFIDDEKISCEEHNIDMILTDSVSVSVSDGPAQGNGCFEEVNDGNTLGILSCAVGKPLMEWLPTFVHETCHKDQCVEQIDCWTDGMIDNMDPMDFIDLWIRNHIELSRQQKDHYFEAAIRIELDCERRALDKILKYNLPIDPTEYIKKANAYVLFYQVMRRTRKWYTIGKEPYAIPEVWEQMPDCFLLDGEYLNYPSLRLMGIIADGTMGGTNWEETLMMLEEAES